MDNLTNKIPSHYRKLINKCGHSMCRFQSALHWQWCPKFKAITTGIMNLATHARRKFNPEMIHCGVTIVTSLHLPPVPGINLLCYDC